MTGILAAVSARQTAVQTIPDAPLSTTGPETFAESILTGSAFLDQTGAFGLFAQAT